MFSPVFVSGNSSDINTYLGLIFFPQVIKRMLLCLRSRYVVLNEMVVRVSDSSYLFYEHPSKFCEEIEQRPNFAST